jgi:endonuclease/exonuclease/phosphatase family metal-dependent hydrolase
MTLRSLFILLAALRMALPTVAAAESARPEALRVMSFNARYSAAKDGDNGWAHRKESFAAAVRGFNPDLLGTQEVMADQFDDLGVMLPGFTAVGVARDDGARKGEWSAVLYRTERFEAVASGTFWLSERPEEVGSLSWDAACVSICTWARLRERATGRVLLFANTHFDHKSGAARVESARLLSAKLPELAAGAPVILTGDFNCTEDSAPYKTLTATLRDSFRAVHPERGTDEATFHGFTGATKGSRIDWILHGPEFTPVTAEIVRPNGGRLPSDHYAVTAVLR